MIKHVTGVRQLLPTLLCFGLVYSSCEPAVRLSGSWVQRDVLPTRYSKVFVMSLGKDLSKRRLGEDHIRAELLRRGIVAVTSLDEFGPDFSRTDSGVMRQVLLDRQFDGVVTIRVLGINERDRWIPTAGIYGPSGYYHGFYGYYYRFGGYYYEPGYVVTDVEVLLESNFYRTSTGELLWTGQSRAFYRDPTPAMAGRYAKNIVDDMIGKGVLATSN
ncbi:hypothetical protein ACQ86N_25915 [Puia sp. P3]|uniref:hypothetical protein n=1 Tax=Puia sp. P3 TaxID=3423952 RepID=UPI003D66625C